MYILGIVVQVVVTDTTKFTLFYHFFHSDNSTKVLEEDQKEAMGYGLTDWIANKQPAWGRGGGKRREKEQAVKVPRYLARTN